MTRNTSNQYSMQNPLTQYPQPEFPAQHQPEPGLDRSPTAHREAETAKAHRG